MSVIALYKHCPKCGLDYHLREQACAWCGVELVIPKRADASQVETSEWTALGFGLASSTTEVRAQAEQLGLRGIACRITRAEELAGSWSYGLYVEVPTDCWQEADAVLRSFEASRSPGLESEPQSLTHGCPGCGAPLPAQGPCGSCGLELPEESLHCPHCAVELQDDGDQCAECGGLIGWP